MGYGTVVATVLVCVVVLASLALLADASSNVAVDDARTLSAMAELEGERMRSDVEVVELWSVASDVVHARVKNTGSVSIRVRDFWAIDIIYLYTDPAGEKIVVWLKHDQEPPYDPDTWHLCGVEGDVVNPIDIAAGTGIWDPGEVIEVELYLSRPVDPAKPWALVFVLPNGVRALASGGG